MQYKPGVPELLQSIQETLVKEILPELEGKEALSYKLLVSWNMLGVILREWNETGWQEALDKFQTDQRLLAEKIRKEQISSPESPEWKMVKKYLEDNLRVANPRFSLE